MCVFYLKKDARKKKNRNKNKKNERQPGNVCLRLIVVIVPLN